MKTPQLITVIIASFVLAASATAKIGETPNQIIARSQRDKEILAIRAAEFGGRPTLEVVYPDGATVTHVFGTNSREIAMCSYVPKRFTDKDVVQIQRLYKTTWRGTGTEGGLFSWESDNGLFMTAKRYETHDQLWIFDTAKLAELADLKKQLELALCRKLLLRNQPRTIASLSPPKPLPG